MPNLYYGTLNTAGVPADEKTVRNTAVVYERDAPAAMATDAPVMQEVETDPNPNLGMDSRQVASKWVEGSRGVSPEVIAKVTDGTANNAIVNNQVSSAGLAPSLEAAGQTNKNLSYAEGIEPVGDLTENGKFGNSYFARNDRDVQDGMGSYMTPPPGYDVSTRAMVAAAGKEKARDASNPYAVWWNSVSG